MKNPFLDSLPLKSLSTGMMDPAKLVSLAQEQQLDTMQTTVAALSCRDPMALMSLQQAFLQRSMERWVKGVAKEATEAPAASKPAVKTEAPRVTAPAATPADVVSLVDKQIEKATEMLEAAAAAHVDDLTVIKGIGPKFAATLADHGITSFHKLASLTAGEIDELEQKLGFSGRFAREGWVEQAKALASH